MLTPKKWKSETLPTHDDKWLDVVWLLPEVYNELLGLCCIEQVVVPTAVPVSRSTSSL